LRAEAPAAPKPLSFPQALESFAAGRPIPLVAVSIGHVAEIRQPALVLDGMPLEDGLHSIAGAYSDRLPPDLPPAVQPEWEETREALAPHALVAVWTIARDRQWQFNDRPNVPDVLEATEPALLLTRLVHALSDDQLRRAASEGLRFEDFRPEQQRVLRAAFRAPVTLAAWSASAPGAWPSFAVDFSGVIPMEQCTIRLSLAFDNVYVGDDAPPGPGSHRISSRHYTLDTLGKRVELPYRPAAPRGYTFPVVTPGPAKLKPGDLGFDGKALDAPVGVSGAMPLGKAVEAAAKATGLTLRADPCFTRSSAAFIGDAKLRTGDALRAIAFDVQGAWRRVGDTFILAYDRVPLAPTIVKWQDQLAALDAERGALLDDILPRKADADNGSVRFFRCLQADPDGPPGPNADQIQRLLAPVEETDTEERRHDLMFRDLTPDQQAAVLQMMRAAPRRAPDDDPDLPAVQQLLPKTVLNNFRARMTLDVPKLGRYKLDGLRLSVFSPYIAGALNPEAHPPAPPSNRPIALKEKVRAVAVPPLSRAEWPRLFAQMRRKCLNVLYLPVLWDGQSLYPSRRFPLLPLARGNDMLAEITAMAAANHVKVIALLHVLAWRHPGGGDLHWLRRHPELVDTDVTGRGRRAWTAERLAESVAADRMSDLLMLSYDPFLFSDLVRPSHPTVKARLLGVLEELRKYRGVSGVALAEWSRVSGLGYIEAGYSSQAPLPPLLGFGVPERAAFIREHSADPMDFCVPGYSPVSIPSFPRNGYGQDLDIAWAKVRMRDDVALLKSLADAAEKAWPGQVHIFSALSPESKEEREALPKGDVTVGGGMAAFQANDGYAWVSAPSDLAVGLPVMEDGGPDRLSSFAERIAAVSELRSQRRPDPNPGIVLDFRAAPGLLWDGLARIASP
jgi:hypothetical protein